MTKININYRLLFFNLTLLLCIYFPKFIFSQGGIEFQVEGKQFKNNETGLSIQYGYISQWNTYGLTFTNKNGAVFYFINCTKDISSDGNSMILTQCRNLNDESAGTVYVYPNRIIQSYPDGRFVYELVKTSDDFDGVQKNMNIGKSESSVKTKSITISSILGKPIKIGNLLVAQYDFPNALNFEDTEAQCAILVNGWRLPTLKELNTLYQNRNKIGGFSDGSYWSSTVTKNDNGKDCWWSVHFLNGNNGCGYYPNRYENRFRVVKEVTSSLSKPSSSSTAPKKPTTPIKK